MAGLFNAMVARGEDRRIAQRFTLQRVAAMFAEHLGLDGRRLGRGLFEGAPQVALRAPEIRLLGEARAQDWAKVEPPIFGTLFQASIGKEERHALGAHFTGEEEIHRVVTPTIVRPFRSRIASARTASELEAVRRDLLALRILDPACGSGNFLYVAFRELRRLELELLARLAPEDDTARLSVKQLHGIDRDPFAVELAKVELLLAGGAAAMLEEPDLDGNIRCDDALFCAWPRADVIIGNPPFQSKNKAQAAFGRAYMNRVRRAHPDVPGHADYCVYWFRRAHDALEPGGRAGLVGTNTIRENSSRRGGLDHIVAHGGTITEAVSTQVWPGDAVVSVSIVNWIKGESPGEKLLWEQQGDRPDSPWRRHELPHINAALSTRCDLGAARDLACNVAPKTTHQGQTPGSRGFVVTREVADAWVREDAQSAAVLFPYLVGDELLGHPESAAGRVLIDFGDRDLGEASRYRGPLAHVEAAVRRAREAAARAEEARNAAARAEAADARTSGHHRTFLERWWRLAYRRADMLEALSRLPRYIACSRVTRRPIFEFVPSEVRPGDALQVFAFSDDYSFGVLQSDLHWRWFTGRCSGLKVDPRYTSETVYHTFPWPQAPSPDQVREVAGAAAALRTLRRGMAREQRVGLRRLYRLPAPELQEAHARLDEAVRAAYGLPDAEDPLRFLLSLNLDLAAGGTAVGPGSPPG
jgi:hypothetical protein